MKAWQLIAFFFAAALGGLGLLFWYQDGQTQLQLNPEVKRLDTLRDELNRLPDADTQKNNETRQQIEQAKDEIAKLQRQIQEGSLDRGRGAVRASEASAHQPEEAALPPKIRQILTAEPANSTPESAARRAIERVALSNLFESGVQNIDHLEAKPPRASGNPGLPYSLTPVQMRFSAPNAALWSSVSKLISGFGNAPGVQIEKLRLRENSQIKGQCVVDIELLGLFP